VVVVLLLLLPPLRLGAACTLLLPQDAAPARVAGIVLGWLTGRHTMGG
jgi:hypothetical protein